MFNKVRFKKHLTPNNKESVTFFNIYLIVNYLQ